MIFSKIYIDFYITIYSDQSINWLKITLSKILETEDNKEIGL